MQGQAIEILDGGRFPECPDCRRSLWEVVRDRLTGNAEREVDVRCTQCGWTGTMVRQDHAVDWRLTSIHRG